MTFDSIHCQWNKPLQLLTVPCPGGLISTFGCRQGKKNSSCCQLEQAIFNSDIILYAADDTIRARAVKTRSWEPISAMLPDKAIFISASRSRKIGAVNLFVSTDTFSEAAAKPFLPIPKGIAKAIPATTLSFFTLDFKARQTCAVNEWVWAPSLMNFENITIFVFTAWKQIWVSQFCAWSRGHPSTCFSINF